MCVHLCVASADVSVDLRIYVCVFSSVGLCEVAGMISNCFSCRYRTQ